MRSRAERGREIDHYRYYQLSGKKTSGRVSVFGYDLEKDVVNANVSWDWCRRNLTSTRLKPYTNCGESGRVLRCGAQRSVHPSEKYLKQLDLWGKRNERARIYLAG